nr:hypothetical protein GCM10020185_42700 [Pseudomonas brassicacearum subsp. brassicacearum]
MTPVNRNKRVVAYSVNPQAPRHEVETNRALAQWLAQILGWEYGDSHDSQAGHDLYLLPTQTLIGTETLMCLGGSRGRRMCGAGMSSMIFICTKAITHGLLNKDAVAPKGWSPLFAKLTRGAVLDGVTVFSLKDARPAAEHLLYIGPIRLKPIHACAGRGQRLIKSLAQFDEIAAGPDAQALFRDGVVLEQHLNEVKTQSVGQCFINGKVLSYCGVQHLTHDSEGVEVYGGSDLLVVQGGYIELLRLELPDDVREAVRLAQVFDDAANQAYPSFFCIAAQLRHCPGPGCRRPAAWRCIGTVMAHGRRQQRRTGGVASVRRSAANQRGAGVLGGDLHRATAAARREGGLSWRGAQRRLPSQIRNGSIL